MKVSFTLVELQQMARQIDTRTVVEQLEQKSKKGFRMVAGGELKLGCVGGLGLIDH